MKNIVPIVVVVLLVAVAGYFAYTYSPSSEVVTPAPLDSTPQAVTLTGTYGCLPHLNPGDVQTQECAFGIQTDEGVYYAVNFGASAEAMNQFKSGERVTAEGFIVIKEALSSDEWAKYNMKGIFTVSNVLSSEPSTVGAKIDINAVCEGALAYMSFPNGAAADAFVADCKEGKHPEVIEKFKADLNLGAGAEI